MADPSERLRELIAEGQRILSTDRPNDVIASPTLDRAAFGVWKAKCLSVLAAVGGQEHEYLRQFRQEVKKGYVGTANLGIELVKAMLADLEAGHLSLAASAPVEVVAVVDRLCGRFHEVARQIRSRHADRATLDVKDEYDVQDLLHALLRLHFDDVRPEEHTPSYAGKSVRMDFLLKAEQVMIEVKMGRKGLGAAEVGTQLIEDITRYAAHPDCGLLYCFVYDPDGWVKNPRGLEHDLGRSGDPFPVRVRIGPH